MSTTAEGLVVFDGPPGFGGEFADHPQRALRKAVIEWNAVGIAEPESLGRQRGKLPWLAIGADTDGTVLFLCAYRRLRRDNMLRVIPDITFGKKSKNVVAIKTAVWKKENESRAE